MEVSIDRCSTADIDDVVQFIEEHWKRGHILAESRALLDWQHRDAGGYAFVLARRRSDNRIVGILGFIATARFDEALENENVLWLTTWKVRDDAGVAGLGLQLLHYLMRTVSHRAVGAIFPGEATAPIYRAMGFHVGELFHYVRETREGSVERMPERPLQARRLLRDEDFSALDWRDGGPRVPRKTAEYFRRRYFRHPVYAYTVTALFDQDVLCGMLAVRTAEHSGARAIRVVDFLGSPDVLERMGPVVQAQIDEVGAEYADIYNAGISADALGRAGFRKVDPDGAEIVPDNFEPFERRNVRLWFAFKGPGDPVLFKGDSDRDRPNRIAGV
jgi:hypothetical protein